MTVSGSNFCDRLALAGDDHFVRSRSRLRGLSKASRVRSTYTSLWSHRRSRKLPGAALAKEGWPHPFGEPEPAINQVAMGLVRV